MKESETIKDFSSHISKLVNEVRLLGEDFPDSRIVEKVLVSLLEKLEHKICSLEDSKDFAEMSLQELVNALQAVEQRQSYRQERTSEEAFVAGFRGKHKPKNSFKGTYGGRRDSNGRSDSGKNWQQRTWQPNHGSHNFKGKEKKENFPPANIVRKPTILILGVG